MDENQESKLLECPKSARTSPSSAEVVTTHKYRVDEHGLLVVVAPDAVRVHGVKVHFQQLWDVLFEEIVHTLKITEPRVLTPRAAFLSRLGARGGGAFDVVERAGFPDGCGSGDWCMVGDVIRLTSAALPASEK